MRILHIMRSVDPAGGGPIEALVQSEPVWNRLGHGREIVCLDLPEDPWVRRCPIRTHAQGHPSVRAWMGRAPWLRYGFTAQLVPWLQANLGRFDVAVVNGLWNFATFAARCVLPYRNTPYFVFTHGMLDPWFRHAHPVKHWAKQISWLGCEGPLLHRAEAVLFTSAGERSAAARAFWPSRFRGEVCRYGTATPPAFQPSMACALKAALPALHGRAYILFLGRLHPKKGGDLLVSAFSKIAASHPDLDLVVAGPDAAGHRFTLQALADRCGVSRRVHWPGMVEGDLKWGLLHGCAAFVLPSHGENFGVSVVEAMGCGRPVLISDKVNIAAEIMAHKAGLVAPDTADGVSDLLSRFLSLSEPARRRLGEQGRNCFEQVFDIERVAGEALGLLGRRVRS